MEPQQRAQEFGLGDAALGALATAAPVRNVTAGKVDLAGRMRVAAILRSAGIENADMPERIAGSTNEVWKAGDYIVRVGLTPGSQRLRREAQLSSLLGPDVMYPKVVASGTEPFGEWMILRNRPSTVLSAAWAGLTVLERRSIVHDLAAALRAVHSVDLDRDSVLAHFPQPAVPHQFDKTQLQEQLELIRNMAYVDNGLISAADELLLSTWSSFPKDEHWVLVHGDIHFENVLVRDGVLVAVLDFEWSRRAPKEVDIDVLARFCLEPQLHVTGSYSADARDYRDVLRWVHEAYPELFRIERISDRLRYCALGYEIPSLMADPPNGPAATLSPLHPLNRLRTLVEAGSYAERLGWLPHADE